MNRMKGYIPIEIPTKKYIKAYILHELGPKPLMGQDHFIGNKLFDLLQHQVNQDKRKFSIHYNTHVRIYISMFAFRQRGCNLNHTNIKNFNGFIESLIKDKFYFIMDFYLEVFPNISSNMQTVRKKLGISEEDWDDDSMRKDYLRYRKKIGKPLLYRKVTPGEKPVVFFPKDGF